MSTAPTATATIARIHICITFFLPCETLVDCNSGNCSLVPCGAAFSAEQVDISTTHVSHIETGNTKLSLSVLVLLAKALEVRTDDLLFENVDTSCTASVNEILGILDNCTPQQLRCLKDLIQSAQISLNKYFI